ncbi:MBL fold metallo-hydrolase [Fundidesulfovibrio soli]|uniref:MBL fold metallo-hydrolase n=1 Tax=Fundidesulfovibrio soli TaxID=2922716 RepID=UPI001FAEC98D|nr:MBL fold metallo-hydrolase [Fundidesulfovibrio soli]
MEPVESKDRQFVLSLDGPRWLAGFVADVPDRSGALAELARLAAGHGVNIHRLLYERGRHPSRVELTLECPESRRIGAVLDALNAKGMLSQAPEPEETPLAITDVSGVLSFKVALDDRPGALAALTERFKVMHASVIHLRYDGDAEPGMAEISVVTSGAEEVSKLLRELTGAGYHYHVLWQGGPDSSVDEVMGLSEVEAFLFKLRSSLPPERMSALEDLFSTSRAMRQALNEFRGASGESGEALAASQIYANILRLAAMAVGTTHERFTLRLTGPVRLTPVVSMYMLSCPEGANSYLLRHGDAATFLDTNFGIYFDDVMDWLALHGLDPSCVRTVLATHPDADHAGWAGKLQQRFGAEVFMHPDSAEVFRCEDRTLGHGDLCGINRPFTRLVSRLTDLVPPERISGFAPAQGEMGGFRVIGRIAVADLDFTVLESLGGHAAAQVFFLEEQRGYLFSGDYLLDPRSLSPKDRDALSVHKSLLTSTNTDSALFMREMGMLKELMRGVAANVAKNGRRAMVFPGHGEFYAVEKAEWGGARPGKQAEAPKQ